MTSCLICAEVQSDCVDEIKQYKTVANGQVNYPHLCGMCVMGLEQLSVSVKELD